MTMYWRSFFQSAANLVSLGSYCQSETLQSLGVRKSAFQMPRAEGTAVTRINLEGHFYYRHSIAPSPWKDHVQQWLPYVNEVGVLRIESVSDFSGGIVKPQWSRIPQGS